MSAAPAAAAAGGKRKEAENDDEPMVSSPSGAGRKRLTSNEAVVDRHSDKDEGVGVVVSQEGSGFVIERILEGASASRANVAVGDRIVAVNGVDITGMSIFQLAGNIRGKAGTSVALTLVSPSLHTRVVTLVRGKPEPVPVGCPRGEETPASQLIGWDDYVTHEGHLGELREQCSQRSRRKAGFLSALFGADDSVDYPRIDEVVWRLMSDPATSAQDITFDHILAAAPAGATTEQLVLAHEKMVILKACRRAAQVERQGFEAKIEQLNATIADLERSQSAENRAILQRYQTALRAQQTTQQQLDNTKTLYVRESAEHETAKRNIQSLERQLATLSTRMEDALTEKRGVVAEITSLAAAVQRVRDPSRPPAALEDPLAYLKDTVRLYNTYTQQQQQQQQQQQPASLHAPPLRPSLLMGNNNNNNNNNNHISSEIAFGGGGRPSSLPSLSDNNNNLGGGGGLFRDAPVVVAPPPLAPQRKPEECSIM